MKQKITFLFLMLLSSSSLVFGQTMVNDFEKGSAEPSGVAGGATWEVVDNPKTDGANTTAKCLKIGRTGTNWWELVAIDIAEDLNLTDETKFVSFWAYGARTDVGARLDKALVAPKWGSYVARPDKIHSGEDQWEQIFIPIIASGEDTTFTGTVPFITFHADIAGIPVPEFVLNNTDSFLYIDEIQIVDSKPILSTSNFELNNSVSLYPNPAKNTFKVNAVNGVTVENISVYNILGKQVNILQTGANLFDISSLSTGMYMVKIKDSKGSLASKKLFVR